MLLMEGTSLDRRCHRPALLPSRVVLRVLRWRGIVRDCWSSISTFRFFDHCLYSNHSIIVTPAVLALLTAALPKSSGAAEKQAVTEPDTPACFVEMAYPLNVGGRQGAELPPTILRRGMALSLEQQRAIGAAIACIKRWEESKQLRLPREAGTTRALNVMLDKLQTEHRICVESLPREGLAAISSFPGPYIIEDENQQLKIVGRGPASIHINPKYIPPSLPASNSSNNKSDGSSSSGKDSQAELRFSPHRVALLAAMLVHESWHQAVPAAVHPTFLRREDQEQAAYQWTVTQLSNLLVVDASIIPEEERQAIRSYLHVCIDELARLGDAKRSDRK